MNATTPPASNAANEALFLDPETHQRAAGKKLRIGDFRSAVDSLNWNRRDLSGATRDEFIRMDVRTRLDRHIAIVESLVTQVPGRFGDDVAHARTSVESARKAIAHWATFQPTTQEG
ncbi:MAG: hypothetical protein ABIZ18_15770 [Caldimonas sp.]